MGFGQGDRRGYLSRMTAHSAPRISLSGNNRRNTRNVTNVTSPVFPAAQIRGPARTHHFACRRVIGALLGQSSDF